MDVAEAFTEVADHYDALVRLNPGYHEHLRSSARALLAEMPDGDGPLRLLDLGCGSGASTEALVTAVHEHGRTDSAQVHGVDASEGMLAAALAKGWPDWVRFRVGRAQDLGRHDLPQPDRPAAGLAAAGRPQHDQPHHDQPHHDRPDHDQPHHDQPHHDQPHHDRRHHDSRHHDPQDSPDGDGFDGVLAAYLVRNVPERDELMSDLYRSLRPGGTLVLHEYVVSGSRWASLVWSLVCWSIVIPLAAVVTGESRLHRYLWRSVLDFDSLATLQDRLHRAGFTGIRRRTFNNWQRGILHTVIATRPSS